MVSRWNGAAEKMFGFSLDGASTSSFEKPFPPEWREEIADVLVRASLGQSARATAVAVRSDGSRLIVETTCPAVTGFNGAPSDYVVLLKDVTEPILVRASATAVAFEPDASAALESLAVVLAHVMPVENLTLTAMEGRGAARRVASAGRCAAKLQSGELLPTAGTALAVGDRAPATDRLPGHEHGRSALRHSIGKVRSRLVRRASAVSRRPNRRDLEHRLCRPRRPDPKRGRPAQFADRLGHADRAESRDARGASGCHSAAGAARCAQERASRTDHARYADAAGRNRGFCRATREPVERAVRCGKARKRRRDPPKHPKPLTTGRGSARDCASRVGRTCV
jgi:PAS domain S-box-containing protein